MASTDETLYTQLETTAIATCSLEEQELTPRTAAFCTQPLVSLASPDVTGPGDASVDAGHASYNDVEIQMEGILPTQLTKLSPALLSDPGNIQLPLLGLVLSVFLPPAGCIIFCLCLGAPESSRKFVWAVRSLYLGSLLSVVYCLLIAMLLSEFCFSSEDTEYGISY